MKKGFNFKGAKRVGDKFEGKAVKVQISIRLDPDVLADIRREAAVVGIPYQTLISSILKIDMDTRAESRIKRRA